MKSIEYSAQSNEIVSKFNESSPQEQSAQYWGEQEVNAIRKEIKDFYIAEQKQKCAYCYLEIPTNNNAVWDAEHIIAKSAAPQFMFEPRNLCVACKDCNIAKKEQDVRVDASRKSFPDKSQHYRIVHPHFDSYEDHIRWYGKVVRPLSDKGITTVEMCNLQRFCKTSLAAEMIPHHPAFAENVGVLLNPHADRTAMQMALAAISEYLKTVPQAS